MSVWSWLSVRLFPGIERETPTEEKILADITSLSLPGSCAYVPSGWTPNEYCSFLCAEQKRRGLMPRQPGSLALLDVAIEALNNLKVEIEKRPNRADATPNTNTPKD